MKWEELAREDTIDWLLEPENPSVRFWALQQILGRPSTDQDVVKAQQEIMHSQCVTEIMSKQSPEGHWASPEDFYLPKYTATTHNLLILAELGAARSGAIERALEHMFQFQRDSGHFLTTMPKSAKGKASEVKDGCCLDGNILFFLSHFGYLDDPRTQRLIRFQEEYYAEEGGWKCRAYPINQRGVFPENCFMGRVKVLRALARIPASKRSSRIKAIIANEVETVLENQIYKYLKNTDGSRKEKAGWKRFGFPLFYQSDALEVLDTLTELGVKDKRMEDSISLVTGAMAEEGRWILKNTFNGKMLCEIDSKGLPSKWITLRALRVLKRFLEG